MLRPGLPVRFLASPRPLAIGIATALLASVQASVGAPARDDNPFHHALPLNESDAAQQRSVDAFSAMRKRFEQPAGIPVFAVENCNDSGAGSLRQAVADTAGVAAAAIDLSALTCSSITLTSGAIVLPDSATALQLQVRGRGRAQPTISAGDASQIFVQSASLVVSSISLAHLTLSHGRAATTDVAAGGCLGFGAGEIELYDVTVENCTATGNLAIGGGASAAMFRAYESTLRNNHAVGLAGAYGGAVGANGLYLYRCDVHDNGALSQPNDNAIGGGLALIQGQITLSSIENNLALSANSKAYGGGINAGSGLQMVSSRVSGNTTQTGSATQSFGGGIAAGLALGSNASLSLRYCLVDANQAGVTGIGSGGGISFSGGTSGSINALSLSNTTVSGNTASGNAGGIEISSGNFSLLSSTVADNHSSGKGGIWIDTAPSVSPNWWFQSSIVAGNTPSDIFSDLGATIVGGVNLVVSFDAGSVSLPDGTLRVDPQLLPLADNGGLTPTHALASTSPAIDAGYNAAYTDNDQRGSGFPRTFGAATDIGAFEYYDRIFANDFEFRSALP